MRHTGGLLAATLSMVFQLELMVSKPVYEDSSAPSGLDQLSMSCIDLFTKVEIEG